MIPQPCRLLLHKAKFKNIENKESSGNSGAFFILKKHDKILQNINSHFILKGFIMTTLRNLLFLVLINFCCALNAKGDTYITNQALPYDVMTPKAAIILNFAQTISSPFSYASTQTTIAQWLTKGIVNYLFDNITIINIANIIESDATLETKIAYLAAIQADWDIQRAQYLRNNSIINGLFFMFFAATVSAIIYDIIKKANTVTT